MSWSFAVTVAVVATSFALGSLLFAGLLLWFYVIRRRTISNKNSESGSSDPSTIDWTRGRRSSCGRGGGSRYEWHGAKQFTLQELEQATKNFNHRNLVGQGSFGSVYKGLLLDGTVVAIKRRVGSLHSEFVEEVNNLAGILHRNLVTLIGFCQEGGWQMLVFEYLPNGSISDHLYDTGQDPTTKLEFKQRLSVAIGAAKGLSHLHSLIPPVAHNNFKTANVLVDENFIAKVADVGMDRLCQNTGDMVLTQTYHNNVFRDPVARSSGELSESSDVYSFGVFLLELITGQDASKLLMQESESLLQWVEARTGLDDFIDRRLGSSYTSEGMKQLINLTVQCLDESRERRPKMRHIVMDLDRILETEMSLTTVMGDGTAIITLGSQLFTS